MALGSTSILKLSRRAVELAETEPEAVKAALIPTVRFTLRWIHELWAPCGKRKCKICRLALAREARP